MTPTPEAVERAARAICLAGSQLQCLKTCYVCIGDATAALSTVSPDDGLRGLLEEALPLLDAFGQQPALLHWEHLALADTQPVQAPGIVGDYRRARDFAERIRAALGKDKS